MSDATKRIEGLSPKQRELLRRRLEKKRAAEGGGRSAEARGIPRQSGTTRRFPLSFSQLRQWILEQLEPGTGAYNLPAPIRLDGALDERALERAIELVVARQESLRTTFEPGDDGGEPVQVIHDPAPFALPVVDLGGLDAAARDAEESRLAALDADRPFDLVAGPLLRLALLRRGERRHTLLFTLHHIVSDGWSRGVFFRALEELYPRLVAGETIVAEADDERVRYADFAVWQRERLAGAELERLGAYWRERLADPPPPLELPADRPRPRIEEHAGAEVERELPPELARRLRALARERGVSLFMLLLAGYDALLYRLTGRRDLAVGTFIANRNRPEIADLVGFFVNTLVLRAAVDPHASFADLLAAARDAALGAFAHQDLPFEKLVEELKPERSTGHSPFFQTMLVLQNARRRELELPGLEVSYLGDEHRRSHFDLTLWVWEEGEALTLVAEYKTGLFDGERIERLLAHYETLLAAAADDPERPVGRLPLLEASERAELERRSLGASWGEDASHAPVVEAFFARAAQTPDAPALEHLGSTLTYGELAARALRLAGRLRALGAGAETRVALLAERSPELVVGLLGTLAAGAAYVPIDPAYPTARRRAMIEDSGAAIVVAAGGAELGAGAGEHRDAPAFVRIEAEEGIETEPADVDPRQAAYVIYTSGSTGRPKGVVVPHSSLAAYTADAREAYAIGAEDRVLQFASASFDASAEEIYPCLVAGATLVLRDDEMVTAVDAFLAALGRLGITVLNLPTAYWHQICDHLAASDDPEAATLPASLRLVIIGGEAARAEALAAWRAAAPERVRLVNTYGPTEATIVATRHELDGETGEQPPPIGAPLAAGSAWVVDRGFELAPEGVPGELLLGGPGVARGYLGRPALTAERFVPDPFGGARGARLYRSGDLARWRGEALDFVGRADHQVKVRGYRIELGEVEATLGRHPAIAQAAAATVPEPGGEHRLAAYLLPAGGGAMPAVAELRRWLGERLPAHMLPTLFIELDELPTTAGGKVDRRRLPAPDRDRLDLGHAYAPPQSAIEHSLAEIWSDLLGVDRIGRHDDFFDLGGHSLLVTRLAARLRRAFDVEIPLLELFNAPTLAQLARVVETAEPGAEALPPMRRADRGQPIPLSFPQERVWFLNRLLPGNLAYNFVFAVRLEGPLQPALLHRALSEILRRHEIFRTTFPAQTIPGRGEQPVQLIHPPMPAHLPAVDLTALGEEDAAAEAERLASDSARVAFDVEKLPLIRWMLVRRGAELHEMVQTEQHLVHDGWSVAVFLRELQALYAAYVEGRESPLPEPEWQFADFAAWQREWIDGGAYDGLRDYWLGKLRGAPLVLELPIDHPRPRVNSHRGALHHEELPYDFYLRLRELDRREGVSLYMTMLAAYFALLARITGQRDVLVGAGVANRRLAESEQVIGMIVNTIVLRGELEGDPSFRELVKRVRRTTLEAHAHQDMPLDRLVGELHPERDLSRNPIFQTMFSFHDSQVPYIEFGGLEGRLEGAHNRSAKLDLGVIVLPHGEQHVGLDGGGAPEGEGVVMYWEYNTDLFDESTIRRLALYYRRILEAVADDPTRRVSELPLLPAEEEARLLLEANDTAEPVPETTIERLVAEQAARRPEAVAIEQGELRLTYAELEARAERVARRLRELGVGRETAVALCFERSPELVVAQLATLKAGGFFVPLDPAYGEERLAFMLADAGAPVVLTGGGALPELAALAQDDAPEVLYLEPAPGDDEALGELAADEGRVEPAAALPDALAYVMYTSGSTGVPKGVAATHRAVLRLVCAERGLRFGPDVAFLGFAPASFDASTLEIWAPLVHGGRLVLAPPGRVSLEELGALIAASGVDHAWLTAGLFHQVVEGPLDSLAGLRRLLAGGDVLSPAHVRRALEALPRTTVINGYGPTENTTFTTCHAMRGVAAAPPDGEAVPIGRPIANTRVYVLDRALRPVPEGVAGELYAAGDGLARGYLGRPALTAERFVPAPSLPGVAPGERLYRTGDLVRWRRGALDFLGREDGQVKLRGFRVETGEIAAAIRRHPAVADCAVIARGEGSDKRLVAYLVAAEGGDPAAVEWREELRARLPEHMLPAFFVVLDELPLTANGKLDRAALPAPEGAESRSSRPPESELELWLAALWQELLGAAEVGAEDDFFELGGHSLNATQVVSRLRRERGVEVPLGLIFERPTVAELARAVEELAPPAVALVAGAVKTAGALAAEAAEAAADVVARAAEMSDEALDALLESMLDEGEKG